MRTLLLTVGVVLGIIVLVPLVAYALWLFVMYQMGRK